MKFGPQRVYAFSLVEVTLALGVAAFCLLAVFGLIPVGVQTNRNSTSQTAATNICALVVADLRALPKTGNSSLFCIAPGTARTFYFDTQGQCSTDLAGLTSCNCSVGSVSIQTRYQVNVTFPPSAGSLTYAKVKVTWPAAADPTTASTVEMFAALDRY